MAHKVEHFMWGYQPHFRLSQECAAARLFRKLDESFKPEIFLVGILDYDVTDRFPACVEPEDDYWIRSEEFDRVRMVAKEIRDTYPESQMWQSHPLAQKRQDDDLLKRSIQDAILATIEAHQSRPTELKFYASYPAKINGYWVSVVLGLQADIFGAYPSLSQSSVEIHELRRMPVAVSLIDAAVRVFLEEATRELLKPDPGLATGGRDVEELLRSAGGVLMTGLAWRIDQNCIEGIHELYRSVTIVSSLRYEKGASVGRILLARKGHAGVNECVCLDSPVNLNAYRTVRKLLELASDERPLYCDPSRVYGIASQLAYDSKNEDLFTIEIKGHHQWEVSHASQVLMRVQYGIPSVPSLPFDEKKLRVDLQRIFNKASAEECDNLVGLIRIAERESHGTMLVVTEDAQAEAVRLSSQGTPIKPLKLSVDTVRNLTPIDGAIIIDPAGVCYAIGTILDGKAAGNGSSGRGARFNSAIRYYESTTAPCMIVVVSSDGGVDFIPNPMPMISRKVIDDAIALLGEFADMVNFSRRLYRKAVDLLDAHRFYLTEDDCNILNPLIAKIDDRIRDEDNRQIWVVRPPYKPDPAMDPSMYYLP